MAREVSASEEFEAEAQDKLRAARYATRKADGDWMYPEWVLRYWCRNHDMIACAEIDRRDRFARAAGVRPRVAREILLTTRQRNKQKLDNEVIKLKQMPKNKLRKLLSDYKKRRGVKSVSVIQLAKYRVNKKRKRWSRRHKD